MAILLCSAQEECAQLTSPVYMGFGGVFKHSVRLDDVEEVTLPVVFHIMHKGVPNGTSHNLPDSDILYSLDRMNEQFRKVPGGTGDGSGVDTKINLCLAQRDPFGAPTTGIVRYDLSGIAQFMADGVAVSGLDDGYPDGSLKSLGCWNVDEYVNIYVVPEINGNNGGGGIQGYAYVGPTNNCLDGIVMLSSRLEDDGYNLGKVLSHEMGHYLGLLHTFENTTSCDQGGNCLVAGDRVCDTPPTTTNWICSAPSCPDALVDNYMDYTGEICREAFTEGQAERMHQTIETGRPNLANGLKCLPPVEFDLGIQYLDYEEQFCLLEQDVKVGLANTGTTEYGMATVQITSSNGVYTEEVFDVAPNTSIEVVVEDAAIDGGFVVEVIALGDQYPANNQASGFVLYEEGDLWRMDFTSDFFGSETAWALFDSEGQTIQQDGPWAAGITLRQYDQCLYDDCYTLMIYDNGGDGIPYGGEVVMWVNDNMITVDVSGDWSQLEVPFCVEDGEPCLGDFDQDGVVGNADLLDLLLNFGCTQNCAYDLDGDDDVDVEDFLAFFPLWGTDCTAGLVMQPTRSIEAGTLPEGIYGYYDLSGRKVFRLGDELPGGIYIKVDENGASKIYSE